MADQSYITNRNTLFILFLFNIEWLLETRHDVNFEEMSKEVLADTLRTFYPSARQKETNEKDEPKPYAKQSI